jgi:hypothetical protein
MNKDNTKQAIIGFMEFTKGITGNKDLKIPEDIAKEYGIEQDDTSNMAIKALEQEQCEDAISRDAVISIIEESQEDDADKWMDYPWKVTPNLLMDEVRKLPSVTPKQRAGMWIKEDVLTYKCSACGGKAIIANWTPVLSDFCPNCGLKMAEGEG